MNTDVFVICLDCPVCNEEDEHIKQGPLMYATSEKIADSICTRLNKECGCGQYEDFYGYYYVRVFRVLG